MNTKPIISLLRTAAVAAALVATTATATLAGGELKIGRQQDSTTLDPIFTIQNADIWVMNNMNSLLVRVNRLATDVEPDLAESWDISEDGLTYTVQIRSGVHYIDDPCFPGGKGREVVAADLVYSLKRHFDPVSRTRNAWLWRGRLVGLDEWKGKGSDYSQEVEGLKALDKYTIQFKLTRPYPQLVYTLAMAPSVRGGADPRDQTPIHAI